MLGKQHATIENLSSSGALLVTSHAFEQPLVDCACTLELKLGLESGWLSARTVRVERIAHQVKIAVEFDQMEPELRGAIEAAIEGVIVAAARRPVLVVDDQLGRRADLIARLSARGMTPLAPRTPLEAVDLLARSHLHINVALLAPSFGQSSSDLRELFAESFPWVTATDISNDVEATVEAAARAWSANDVARLATAIA
jgi:predicted nucleic acid-binding protein